MSNNQLHNLSSRLNHALEVTGISQAELARMIGVKPQTIHYLCSTQAESSKFTFEIANALGISFQWLAVGEGDIRIMNKQPQITTKLKIRTYTIEELHTKLKTKSDTFNLEYPFEMHQQDQSMWPRFPQGTILVFDQKTPIKNGSFILVYSQNINDFLFRELVEQGSKKILVPFNSSIFKEVPLQEPDIILGTLTEARWRIET